MRAVRQTSSTMTLELSSTRLVEALSTCVFGLYRSQCCIERLVRRLPIYRESCKEQQQTLFKTISFLFQIS